MAFTAKEEELAACCLADPPDLDAVRRMLTAREADVNACDDGDTPLGLIFEEFAEREAQSGESCEGKGLVDIVRLFLDCGFDVRARDGEAGYDCLLALKMYIQNEDTLRIADMLLEAGLDPGWENEAGETILTEIDRESAFLEISGFPEKAEFLDRLHAKLEAWLERNGSAPED